MAGRDLYNAGEHYFKRGNRANQDLLLTFDDGPHEKSAPEILDILKAEHVPATFFVVGKRVKLHPELVKRMIAEGHEVGNHTQDHLRLDLLTSKQIENEIQDCEINVERACGRRTTLLRPPGMRLTPKVNAEVSSLGYTIVGWNLGAKDFIPDQQITDMSAEESRTFKTTPDEIVDRVLKQAKNGVIILLHDNPVTAEALPTIIEKLKAEGYRFVSTAQMMDELPHPILVVSNPPSMRLAAKPKR
ncbi:MAG TPA: polysaccharide deacetylase family protein [Fimbriimonas sp.]|nr:polysaccharide deacetylase family protein [Fimbriimonas sp.]